MPLSQSDSHTEKRGGTPGEGRLKKLLKVTFFLTKNLFPPIWAGVYGERETEWSIGIDIQFPGRRLKRIWLEL